MHIDLPEELLERVRKRSAKHEGVSEADIIKDALDLLDWADDDNPSEEILKQSLAVIDRSMADIAAGRLLTVADARQQTLEQLGYAGK